MEVDIVLNLFTVYTAGITTPGNCDCNERHSVCPICRTKEQEMIVAVMLITE